MGQHLVASPFGRAAAMSYDGPEPDFNTSLNGIDEFVVAESDWGVDNKKINELIHSPKSNKYTIKPISRSLLFGSSEFTDTNTFFKSEEPIETLGRIRLVCEKEEFEIGAA